jgi:hypothetical protein
MNEFDETTTTAPTLASDDGDDPEVDKTGASVASAA